MGHPSTPSGPPGSSPGESSGGRSPKLTVHGLRDTWATLAMGSGVHAVVVKERLGHSTITITFDLYTHSTQVMDADAAATVAARVFGR